MGARGDWWLSWAVEIDVTEPMGQDCFDGRHGMTARRRCTFRIGLGDVELLSEGRQNGAFGQDFGK